MSKLQKPTHGLDDHSASHETNTTKLRKSNMPSEVPNHLDASTTSNRADCPNLAATDGSDDERIPNYTPSSSSRQFTITRPSMFGKTLHINDAHGGQIMTCELHSWSKPHVVMTSTTEAGTSGETVADITFHSWSRSISLTVRGYPFEIQQNGVFKPGYMLQSPSTGQRLEWQGRSTSVLVDETGNAVAKLEVPRLQGRKDRSVEIVGPWADSNGGRAVEEVLASALAIIELKRRRSRSGAAGGAGGGGRGGGG